MSEQVPQQVELTPVEQMRDFLCRFSKSDYDIEDMMQFIILHGDTIRATNQEDIEKFYESLDIPEVGIRFTEEFFDNLLEIYDDSFGPRFPLSFPETGRVPSSNWNDELQTLMKIFEDTSTKHPESHALYIAQHAKELRNADRGAYANLIVHPVFLMNLVRVYDFEETEEKRYLPESWPDTNFDFLYDVLCALGYKYTETYTDDWKHTTKESSQPYVDSTQQLLAIAKLETERQGATYYLSQNFGIRHFSRYPTELLVKQFDNRGKVDRPYGVIIGAASDHNSALSSSGMPELSRIGRLHASAKDSHDILIAEAETGPEFLGRLRNFHRLNNNTFQIDFALIETHGSPECLKFGAIPTLGHLALEDMNQKFDCFFSQAASVTLTGCSAGRVNGIGQELSQKFQTTVVAAQEVICTTDIFFTQDKKTVRLIPTYKTPEGESVTPVIYRNGSPLGLKRTEQYLTK